MLLTEAVELLLQEPAHDFIGAVPWGDTGTAIDDHRLDIAAAKRFIEHRLYPARFVFDDAVTGQLMTFITQVLLDRLAARIRGLIPRVADGYDKTTNTFFGPFFMFVDRHRVPL